MIRFYKLIPLIACLFLYSSSFGQDEKTNTGPALPDDKGNPSQVIEAGKVVPNAAPPTTISDKFIEKWEILSARSVSGNFIDKEHMLSTESFFKFVSAKKVLVKINEFYPVMVGEFAQSPLKITITFQKNPNCQQCPDVITITRKTEADKEFMMEYFGYKQLFTINKIRQGQ